MADEIATNAEVILNRVLIRKPDITASLAKELIQTATDRIALRVEESEFPDRLNSIAVEVVIAMFNRSTGRQEGVVSEGVDTFSISFVEKFLDEYDQEFALYKKMKAKEENANDGVVFFL